MTNVNIAEVLIKWRIIGKAHKHHPTTDTLSSCKVFRIKHYRCSSSWTSRIFLSLALSIFGLILPSSTFPCVRINFEIFSFVFRPFPPLPNFSRFVATFCLNFTILQSGFIFTAFMSFIFICTIPISFQCILQLWSQQIFLVDTSLISPWSWGEIISL